MHECRPSRIELCKTDDVGVGEVLKVETAGLTLAVYNVDGDFYVTDDSARMAPARCLKASSTAK